MKLMEPLSGVYSDPDVVELRQMEPGKVVLQSRKADLRQLEVPKLALLHLLS